MLTGPSSGLEGTRQASKSSKAEIHSISEVTIATIAYACVQVSCHHIYSFLTSHLQTRFALSSVGSWSYTDGCFDVLEFHDNIVRLMESKRDPWVVKVLDKWNR